MHQEIITLTRLKNIDFRLEKIKYISAFEVIDIMTDEEIKETFSKAIEVLTIEGRI